MDAKVQDRPAASSSQDFEPSFDWVINEEGNETLVLHLPGFRKEQLSVEFNNRGKLSISVERLVENNRPNRFQKDFGILKNCKPNEIKARFVDETLYITLPKTTNRIPLQDQWTSVSLWNLTKQRGKVFLGVTVVIAVLVGLGIYAAHRLLGS
ncbi:PREDICTED: uncharacterized protein LOC104604124 [Nelumbo nucifera]|uniref:SHSP domain-containing protein n=2 Tax=Nelumbo nucifera TaxID=4432 RepID=A0A822YC55_NELNU|nr:PREDICTED: uncharacterized protein LOC104604124 [Nelumbo nucifera]DAD29101.1 TPA_asm: hypothetical protein HUJ06_030569 [Nelumbo nucifera]